MFEDFEKSLQNDKSKVLSGNSATHMMLDQFLWTSRIRITIYNGLLPTYLFSSLCNLEMDLGKDQHMHLYFIGLIKSKHWRIFPSQLGRLY